MPLPGAGRDRGARTGLVPERATSACVLAGIECGEALPALARATETMPWHGLGVPAEDASIHPHLTLARPQEPSSARPATDRMVAGHPPGFRFLPRRVLLSVSFEGRTSTPNLKEFPLS